MWEWEHCKDEIQTRGADMSIIYLIILSFSLVLLDGEVHVWVFRWERLNFHEPHSPYYNIWGANSLFIAIT